MNTDMFEFYCPVKIISGALALTNLPYEMGQVGAKRAMVVTDAGVKGAGLVAIVEKAFEGSGCEIAAMFDETPPDSSAIVVNNLAKMYKEKNCDCLVAVGGGSCIDTAKGVNIVVSEKTDDLMKYRGADRLTARMQPFFVVPTTAGTGSEVTQVAVINNTQAGVKMSFKSPLLYPNAAFLDPRMTMTVPPKITAATGMDALTHAVEAYYCLAKNPVSDSFAVSAIKLIMGNLESCVASGGNEQSRLALANGSLLAGIAFSNSMVGVVHSLAHSVGGVCHVPHGLANSILLPYGMENNIDKRAEIIAELAPLLCGREVSGSAKEKSRAAVQGVKDLVAKLHESCGLATTLSAAGVTEDKLPQIAKLTINDGSLIYNPEDVTYEDALALLKKAF